MNNGYDVFAISDNYYSLKSIREDDVLTDYDSNVELIHKYEPTDNVYEDTKTPRKLESISIEYGKTMEEVENVFNIISDNLDILSDEENLIKLSYTAKIEFTKSLLETINELAKIINEE